MKTLLDVRALMRDGTVLSADVYLPDVGDARYPTLICRTIYDKQDARYVEWAARFAAAGYAAVLQDVRGRFGSDGIWEPYVCERDDGHDTVEWFGSQPWCDGRVGMFGISYPGFTQTAAALGGSSYLRALMPIASQEDNFGHIWVNGVLQLQSAVNFAKIGRRTPHHEALGRIDLNQVYNVLPVRDALDGIVDSEPFRDFVSHSTFDDFWQNTSLKGKYSMIQVPACFLTGWYDNLLHEQFKLFQNLRTDGASPLVRDNTTLIVGPWAHSILGRRIVAGVDFGADAELDLPGANIDWFDSALAEAPADARSPLRIFVMGANVWRDEWEWPLARTVWRDLYLSGEGSANSRSGDGTLTWAEPTDAVSDHDVFRYDPLDPVPTWGGQSAFIDNNGPRDRADLERRDDILVYTSGELAGALEITGPITLTLFAATDAVDTDWTATLVDVHPDGQALHVCEGIVRARFHDTVLRESFLAANEVHELTIDLWETSIVFGAGHRIRLEISSSNFPRFDRNTNTDEPPAAQSRVVVANQRVFHDARRRSRLRLPTIPDSPEPVGTGSDQVRGAGR